MIRLLIYLGLIYFCYRSLKTWVQKNALSGKKPSGQIDDIMVKDPFCEVYFPKREAVHLNINGEDLYFCSTECRDKFIASGRKTG